MVRLRILTETIVDIERIKQKQTWMNIKKTGNVDMGRKIC